MRIPVLDVRVLLFVYLFVLYEDPLSFFFFVSTIFYIVIGFIDTKQIDRWIHKGDTLTFVYTYINRDMQKNSSCIFEWKSNWVIRMSLDFLQLSDYRVVLVYKRERRCLYIYKYSRNMFILRKETNVIADVFTFLSLSSLCISN